MCSRYGIDEKAAQWMRGYCNVHHVYYEQNEHLEHYVQTVHDVQDVHPNDIAPVLIGRSTQPAIVPMTWGFERKCTGGLTIRMETLWQRPMFAYSIQSRRCILPASQFYEWDADKHKATFCGANDELLFLAGIYRNYGAPPRFVIITQPADEVMMPVHDRMPVRIPEVLIDDWLYDDAHTHEILETATVPLVRNQATTQLSLW
jgi:putative SOS response-associated peptidase YedK